MRRLGTALRRILSAALYYARRNRLERLAGGAEEPAPPGDEHFASVVLLAHFDGADGATTTVDSSSSAKTITLAGGAQLDTAVKKFGSSALLLPSAGAYAQLADSPDWNFGSGDFTIEAQVLFDSVNSNQAIVCQWGDTPADNAFALWAVLGGLYFRINDVGGSVVDIGNNWTPALDTLYHVAVDRSGNTLRVYVDGTPIATQNFFTFTLRDSSVPLHIGRVNATYSIYDLDGTVDEVRITKGVARYAGAFTPPTEAFPDSL